MNEHPYLEMGDLLAAQERERILAGVLRRHGITALETIRAFEAGCARGYNLRLLVQWGARPENLAGMEPDPAAAAYCRSHSPGIRIHQGSPVEIPEDDQEFDLALAFALFSKVRGEDAAHGIARELFRITKPGGLIVIWDMRRKKPGDPGVHAVDEDDIRRWFPKCPLRVRPMTLAPGLGRNAGRYAPWLYGGLSAVPALRTHAMYVLRRPATSPFPAPNTGAA